MMRRRVLIVTKCLLAVGGLLLAGYGSTEVSAGIQGVAADPPGVTQNKDNVLPGSQRFVILPAFANDAVLDKQTGLVWEKSPQTKSAKWTVARRTCNEKSVGGQKGWRLPLLEELASLVDYSVAPPGLALPPGPHFWPSGRPSIGLRRGLARIPRAHGACISVWAAARPSSIRLTVFKSGACVMASLRISLETSASGRWWVLYGNRSRMRPSGGILPAGVFAEIVSERFAI